MLVVKNRSKYTVWVGNLFGRNSPSKKVAVINWETHVMQINLKDLGDGFNIEAINEGNEFISEVNNNTFQIRPGTYIVTVTKSGYQTYTSPPITLTANVCHVIPQSLTVNLQSN